MRRLSAIAAFGIAGAWVCHGIASQRADTLTEQCLSNVRQLSAALLQYTADTDGHPPPAFWATADDWGTWQTTVGLEDLRCPANPNDYTYGIRFHRFPLQPHQLMVADGPGYLNPGAPYRMWAVHPGDSICAGFGDGHVESRRSLRDLIYDPNK